ncbi:MAG: hypothetical protein GX434_01705 [Peptococcaceae bacterium]|nr:hypothetical protein [Peptococcaceae bacterium]
MKLTVISDKGTPMVVVTKIARKDDTIEIVGQLMGAWPTKMYITTEEFGGFLRAVLSVSVISYLIRYPFYYLKMKLKREKPPAH